MKPPQSPSSAYSRVQSAPGSRSPVRGDSAARHGSAAVGGGSRTGSGAVRRGGTASRVSQCSTQAVLRPESLDLRTDVHIYLLDVHILRPSLAQVALAITLTGEPRRTQLAYKMADAA